MDTITQKIRALLDKAESTTFDAERDSFIAAATRLMVKHQIDRATVAAAGPVQGRGSVAFRRLEGQAKGPYAIARAHIAMAAAQATGATTWRGDGAIVFVGFQDQLDASESLYTSLLLQAARAVDRAHRPGERNKLSFTRNFMIGFANRVLQRIEEAAEDALADAERRTPGSALALVGAHKAIDAFIADEGIRFRRQAVRVEPATYRRGVEAGDRADIGQGRIPARPDGAALTP